MSLYFQRCICGYTFSYSDNEDFPEGTGASLFMLSDMNECLKKIDGNKETMLFVFYLFIYFHTVSKSIFNCPFHFDTS